MKSIDVIKNLLPEYEEGELYLGIDVGSVSTKCALINEDEELLYATWSRNKGSPIKSVQENFKYMEKYLPESIDERIKGVGTTGSARNLVKALVGADIARTEIISHAVAASYYTPGVRTILEIGGQDSKVIIMRNSVVTDFAMNSVCAAGTGSFLDHQAHRLGIPIEEFGDYAARSENPVQIAGRCTVFAESDMVHKQQEGHSKEDIIRGLCNSLVRNYLNNVCKGKKLNSPYVFQGGVAANSGIRRAFEEELGGEVIVHNNYLAMGAIGAAMLAQEFKNDDKHKSDNVFRGFEISSMELTPKSYNCDDCPNLCEINYIENNGNASGENEILARWGSRCGKWNT